MKLEIEMVGIYSSQISEFYYDFFSLHFILNLLLFMCVFYVSLCMDDVILIRIVHRAYFVPITNFKRTLV